MMLAVQANNPALSRSQLRLIKAFLRAKYVENVQSGLVFVDGGHLRVVGDVQIARIVNKALESLKRDGHNAKPNRHERRKSGIIVPT